MWAESTAQAKTQRWESPGTLGEGVEASLVAGMMRRKVGEEDRSRLIKGLDCQGTTGPFSL